MDYRKKIIELINSIEDENILIYILTWIRLYTESTQ